MINSLIKEKNNKNKNSQNDKLINIKKIIKNNLTMSIMQMIQCHVCKTDFLLNNALHWHLKLKVYIKFTLSTKIESSTSELLPFIKMMKFKIIMFSLKIT